MIDALADLPATCTSSARSRATRRGSRHAIRWVHGVDRSKLAEVLSRHRPAGKAPLNVCVEVNISQEATKGGVKPGEALALARHIASLPGLRFRGLMGMASPSGDEAKARAEFAVLRSELEAIRAAGLEGDTLSMGMSQDWRAALAEGARCCASARPSRARGRGLAGGRGMKVTLLGGGNMGAAIIGGLVARDSPPPASRSSSRARRARGPRRALRRGGAGDRRPGASGRRRARPGGEAAADARGGEAARAARSGHRRCHHCRRHPHRGPVSLAGRARRHRARHAQHARSRARGRHRPLRPAGRGRGRAQARRGAPGRRRRDRVAAARGRPRRGDRGLGQRTRLRLLFIEPWSGRASSWASLPRRRARSLGTFAGAAKLARERARIRRCCARRSPR